MTRSDKPSDPESDWICVQIGARDHYAFPRALARRGKLRLLLTDAWCPPHSPLARLPSIGRLAERWNPELSGVRVLAPTLGAIAFEVAAKARRLGSWEKIRLRNLWFQQWALRTLRKEAAAGRLEGVTDCFSYSYAAKNLFGWCRAAGIRATLGQVDPGIGEWDVINGLRNRHPEWNEEARDSPPDDYWADWREELALADAIIVNSKWSMEMLQSGSPPRSKFKLVPLAIDVPAPEPRVADPSREMRVLFLGQVCLRKGIQELVEAARLLANEPVRFDVIGDHGKLPPGLPRNLEFHGKVSRSEAANWYRRADVFVLPTHSDGFALTQLEAMAHGLPVVTTERCGELVENGVNGILIPVSDARSLADGLIRLARDPDRREAMGEAARATAERFSIDALAAGLLG